MRFFILISSTLLLFAGCSGHSAVAPSQNSSLQSISPSTTAVSKGGKMQHVLDNWLQNEWTPLTSSDTSVDTDVAATPKAVKTSLSLKTEESAPEEESRFTLQHYVEKWERYHENQKKIKENTAQEPSNSDRLKQMPIIGK